MMNINLDMYSIKRKVEDLHATVKGYPEIKAKVKSATNSDPWGPTQQQMQEICEACYGYEDKALIMRALWKRITTSTTKEWPHIYKSLAVMEYLVLHGPDGICDEVRDQLYNLKTLHDFHFVDEKGVDKGLAIREKSKRLVEWASDPKLLQEERAKSSALQSKFVGISNIGERNAPRTTAVLNAGPASQSSSSRPEYRPKPVPQTRFEDVEALQSDETYVQQQRQILDSIGQTRRRSQEDLFASPAEASEAPRAAAKPVAKAAAKPKPKSATMSPAKAPPPVVHADPFASAPAAAAAPKPKPKPSADLTDFFDTAPSAADFDPFAAPMAPPPAPVAPARASPPPNDDLFGDQAAFDTNPNDLFASGDANPFFDTGPAAAEKKTTFQDPTFDSLITRSIDTLSSKPKAAEPLAGPGGAPQSLRSLKAQQQQKQQTAPAPQSDAYNPFL